MFEQFPKWLYHATNPARIVASAEEADALGDEWAESPVETDQPAPAKRRGRPPKLAS
jgi:hypothetical protein